MGAIAQGMKEGLALPPDLTVSEWAEENVVLTSELAAEPGPYRTGRTPYAREMQDVQLDPDIEIITYHTSAQVAKTTCELNGIGYHIAHDPCPMLMVLPNDKIAETFSKAKLAPFLVSAQCLRERVGNGRATSGTMFRKEYPGGFLNIAGANTPAGLAMNSVRIVWADEIDRFPVSAGKEGDPLLLAFKRSQTFVNRKLVVSSTPTVKGMSRIDDFFAKSDQRYFYVRMPCCGCFSKLVWENVKWRPGEPWTAEYLCADGCGSLLSDAQVKLAIIDEKSHWRAEAPQNKGHAGFHLWQIYSPWSSLREIVQGYEETKSRADLHVGWVNTTLGESYDGDQSAEVSAEALHNGRIEFRNDQVPDGACVVCASVDVQKDWLELLVAAFGPNKSVWLMDHQRLFGDPSGNEVWKRLAEALLRRYPQASHPNVVRGIEGVAIDSGYLTQQVYDFCVSAHMAGRPWYAIKGQSGEGKAPWSLSKKKLRNGAKLHNIGTDAIKEELYSRFASEDARENNIYIRKADCFDEGFCAQLIAERTRQIIDGRGFHHKEWYLPPGVRNEGLDLTVYVEAVHRHLNIDHNGRLQAMRMTQRPSLADIAAKFAPA